MEQYISKIDEILPVAVFIPIGALALYWGVTGDETGDNNDKP